MKYQFSSLTTLKSKLFAILAVGLLAGPMAAHAVPISTSVGDFEVSTINPDVSFNDVAALLMSQVWWGDPTLAAEFAELVGTSIDGQRTNSIGIMAFFAWGINPTHNPPVFFL